MVEDKEEPEKKIGDGKESKQVEESIAVEQQKAPKDNESAASANEGNVEASSTNTSQSATTATSKLDTLPREDLIRIVKKQLATLKETRNQLKIARQEAQENVNKAKESNTKSEGSDNTSSDLISLELSDYKNSLQSARKELIECRQQLGEKESLLNELSAKIAELTQEKEEIHEQLKQSSTGLNKLKYTLDEKTRVIAEQGKEIDSLTVQLSETRAAMQREMDELNDTVQEQRRQLATEQRSDTAKNAEIRRLRNECEILSHKFTDLQDEHNRFKEKAEFALKVKDGTQIGQKPISSEIQELIETLSARNAKISQLSSKCSFLEEELVRSEEHAKALRAELDSLNDSLNGAHRQSYADRQRLCQEYEQRLKKEEMAQAELRRELRATHEREYRDIEVRLQAVTQRNEELSRDNERLTEQLREIVARSGNSSGGGGVKPQQEQASAPQQLSTTIPSLYGTSGNKATTTSITRRNKPPPINFNIASLSGGQESFEPQSNSESDESSADDLQSIVNGLEVNASLTMPNKSINVASLDDVANGDTMDEEYDELTPEHFQVLNDSEETNVRLEEQIKVLKEEIRRMLRNQERAQHIASAEQIEYFKNIVLKFLSPPRVNDERYQLLPVLQTMLRLSADELDQVRKNCSIMGIATTDESTPSKTDESSSSDWFGGYFVWK